MLCYSAPSLLTWGELGPKRTRRWKCAIKDPGTHYPNRDIDHQFYVFTSHPLKFDEENMLLTMIKLSRMRCSNMVWSFDLLDATGSNCWESKCHSGFIPAFCIVWISSNISSFHIILSGRSGPPITGLRFWMSWNNQQGDLQHLGTFISTQFLQVLLKTWIKCSFVFPLVVDSCSRV